jgi:hypothetical protein
MATIYTAERRMSRPPGNTCSTCAGPAVAKRLQPRAQQHPALRAWRPWAFPQLLLGMCGPPVSSTQRPVAAEPPAGAAGMGTVNAGCHLPAAYASTCSGSSASAMLGTEPSSPLLIPAHAFIEPSVQAKLLHVQRFQLGDCMMRATSKLPDITAANEVGEHRALWVHVGTRIRLPGRSLNSC